MLILLIIALVLAIAGLIAQLSSNYYVQVKLIRKFFRNNPKGLDEHEAETSLIQDVDYMSVFPEGKLDVYAPKNMSGIRPLLVWVHGGGYLGGDKIDAKPWAHTIAANNKISVASINYCLSPEQHYPTPIIQLGEAIRFLLTNSEKYNVDAGKIFLAGDSAGAQIVSQFAALVCSRKLREEMKLTPPIERNQLRGILLCCGFYNLNTVMSSHFPGMKTLLWAYTNSKKIADFEHKDEMSAVHHINENYCDTYLTCGNADPFIGQAKEFAEKLRENKISSEIFLPDEKGIKLYHEYQFKVTTPYGYEALQRAVDFIAKRI